MKKIRLFENFDGLSVAQRDRLEDEHYRFVDQNRDSKKWNMGSSQGDDYIESAASFGSSDRIRSTMDSATGKITHTDGHGSQLVEPTKFDSSAQNKFTKMMSRDFSDFFQKHPDVEAVIYNPDTASPFDRDGYIARFHTVINGQVDADKYYDELEEMEEELAGYKDGRMFGKHKSLRLERDGSSKIVKTEY